MGLVLLIYTDPQFRLIFSGAGTTGFPTTGFRTNGTFPGGFNGTFRGGNFTRGAGVGALGRVLSFNAASVIESLLGVGLVGVGIVFIAIELFMGPARVK